MTKCSWKKKITALAGTFLLLALTYANPAFASNKVVEGEVEAFMKGSVVTDAEKQKLIDDRNKAKDKCGMSFENYDYWNKVTAFQMNDVDGYAWTADKSFWSTVGNVLDSVDESIEGMFSGYLNTMEDIKRQIDYYHKGALKNAKTPEAIDEANKKYEAIMAKYNALYQATEEVRKACAELDNFDSDALAGGALYKYFVCPDGETDTSKCTTAYYYYDEGTAISASGNMRGCIPLPVKLNESKSCLFCPLFKQVFNAAQDMTTKSYFALAGSIANVMLIGFALWVAFSLLGKVSSFTKMDAPKYITELLTQAFKVLVAYLLLRDASALYNYLLGPLLKAGMEFGMSLLTTGGNKYLQACDNKGALSSVTDGLLPKYIYVQLECFIQAVQAELAVPQSIGSSLMCFARKAGSSDIKAFGLVTIFPLPDFSVLFQGLIIWAFAWLISLAFAFYLVDATVRLGIVGALMPFLIASWPFKLTSKYTNQGFTMFMNTFFTYVFMGLVVSVNISLMSESLSGVSGGFKAVAAALNSDRVKDLTDILDIGFGGFLILIASCIFGFKLTAQATELAGSMAGGGAGSPIAPQIGGMGASVAKAGALGAGKMAWGGTKMAGNLTGVTPKLRQGRDKALGWVGKKLGFGDSSGGGAPTPTSSPAPSSSPAAPTPTSTPPNTPPTGSQEQQAERVQGAETRPDPTPTPPTPAPGSDSASAQAQAASQQSGTQTGNEPPKPVDTPPMSPEELQNKYLKEFDSTNAGNVVNQAISTQTERRAEQRKKVDNLEHKRQGARGDVRFFENAAHDEKLGEDVRANMAKEAQEARRRVHELDKEIKAAEQEVKRSNDILDSLNELKKNTSEQYVNNKIDPKNTQQVNDADVVAQVNNLTI